jgi:drug/metabolite transporter (DMT)-like permease
VKDEWSVNQRIPGLGWLAVITGALIFSTGGIFIRYLSLPAVAIAFLTQSVTMLVLLCWQLPQFRTNWRLLREKRGSLYRILGLGVLRSMDRLFFTAAVLLAPIAKVLVIAFLFPIITIILAHRFLGERITARSVIAALTALTGVIILVLPELQASGSGDLQGMMLAGVVAIVLATIRIVLKGVDRSIPTPFMLTVENLVATATLAPIMLLILPVRIPLESFSLIILGGLLYGVVAHAIVLAGLRRVPAGPAAIVGYLEPVSAVLLAWWLLSEPVTLYTLFGGTLILAGSLSAVLLHRSQARQGPVLEAA